MKTNEEKGKAMSWEKMRWKIYARLSRTKPLFVFWHKNMIRAVLEGSLRSSIQEG